MQDNLYERIVRERGSMERVLARLPGFRGYKEIDARRQADRLMREFVAGKLREQLNRLPQVEKVLLDNGGLAYMSETRSIKTKFQTFIDRVATDAPGYSGFFDAVKIGPDDLAIVYAFDEALLSYADGFSANLEALQAAALKNEGVSEALRELDALTIEANEAYNMRENVLKGLE